MDDETYSSFLEHSVETHPLGRVGRPQDIADAILRVARGEDTARWEVIDFPGYDADGKIEDS